MRKKSLMVMVIFGIAVLFAATVIYAGTTVPDVVKMENKAYAHKKGIVSFTHKKHTTDYKAGCGDCHHDASNKPLVLKAGDNVQGCIECHKLPGEAPKGKDAPKLDKKQKLEYHAEAIHNNCKDCHKASNTKTGTTAAPTTCAKCHPKK
ncbi:MAG: cytochrome c3 family protein [Candidatus Desulfaltia sp.]|nr:cytochrome c3 family protein [Candidatus Desulfaltia sp.]